MSVVRNTMGLVEKADKYISEQYDMHYSNMKEIFSASSGAFDMIHYAFKFGYMQGLKAAKAEQKARAAV